MPHTTRPPARSRTARGRPRSATARRGSAAAERGCRLSRHLLARLHHGVGRHAGVGLDNRARAHPRAPAPIIAPGSTRAPCAAPSRAWGRSRTWLYASGNAIPRGSRPDGRFLDPLRPARHIGEPPSGARVARRESVPLPHGGTRRRASGHRRTTSGTARWQSRRGPGGTGPRSPNRQLEVLKVEGVNPEP